MIILATTTDKLQVITSAAGGIDVHASWIDATTADPPVVTDVNRTNTSNINTAATTDIVAAPAASTTRNIKALHITNIHASTANDVTVQYNQNGTLIRIHKASLAAGEALEYVDGVGFFEITAPLTRLPSGNSNTADVVANAADTYLTGSSIALGSVTRLQAGSFFRWYMRATKTAAGTAAPVFNVRFGTAGTTSDTARTATTLAAQTAATDTGWWRIECRCETHGANGVIESTVNANHLNATTGFGNVQLQDVTTTSAAFDTTVASSIIGVSVNPGASGVWTFQVVTCDAVNLLEL